MLDRELFRNPPVEYRSAPFWSLNDKLDQRYLRQQIRTMFEQGMGGFFMHPRAGLLDPYLSDDFFDAIKVCVEEGKRLGMQPWLYDEDRFPSGFAGGLVMERHPDLGAKALELRDGEVSVVDLPPTNRMHGKPYPDLANPKATAAFLDITHERYARELGSELGTVIPGIFTDEPHFDPGRTDVPRLPWSTALPAHFRESAGYDLAEHLKSLFLPEGDWRKIRFDYWRALTTLFRDSFTKQIERWCRSKKIAFTGHFWEHVFPSPTYTGAAMPNYAHMQIPGIDMLFNTDARPDQVGNDLVVKEVASIADQLEKQRVLSETYGASGWGLSFADQKRIADWQFSLGVNLVCQHLVHYSLRGYRKRDFPLSFGKTQPWAESYSLLGDYIGRMSYALTRGTYVADVLVLHPAASTWVYYEAAADPGVSETAEKRLDEIGGSAKRVCVALNQLHVGYHLGDELVMAEKAGVADGALHVGAARYETILVPDAPVITRSTFDLLVKFVSSGGSLICLTDPPSLIDGEEADELTAFFRQEAIRRVGLTPGADIDAVFDGLATVLDEVDATIRGVEISDRDGGDARTVYAHYRTVGEDDILFIANTSREEAADITVKLPWGGGATVWDALTGEAWAHQGSALVTRLPVAGSLLLTSTVRDSDPSVDRWPSPVTIGRNTERSFRLDDWRCDRVNMNALTLKRATLATADGSFSAEGDILDLDDRLRDHLGIERRGNASYQPWAYTSEDLAVTANVAAAFPFEADDGLAGGSSAQLYVAAEEPGTYVVRVNGSRVRPSTRRFYNRVFPLSDVREYLQPGINIIEVGCERYSAMSGFEWIYLAGDFRVTRPSSCVASDPLPAIAVETVPSVGDWTQRGYPYYSGSMRYTTHFDNMGGSMFVLAFGDLWMACSRVAVNGRTVGIVAFPPYEIDISGYVGKGRNTIVLEVMNTMQNRLGPHEESNDPGFCTPDSFHSTVDRYFEKSGFAGTAMLKVE